MGLVKMDILKILACFRKEENLKKGDLKGIPMCTLSKQEILDKAKKI